MNSAQFTSTNAPLALGGRSLSGDQTMMHLVTREENHLLGDGLRFPSLEPRRRRSASQFISHAFQDELRFVGIRSSPSIARRPEGNGYVERFIRTLKEQLHWLTRFASVEELHAALQEFSDRFNNLLMLGRLGCKTPAKHRRSFLVEAA